MIEIDIGPFLVSAGTFLLSWHGFFSFIAVATAVYLVGRWAPMKGIDPDDVYSIAVWAILSGIVGARLVHVIDNLGFYQYNLLQILFIWSGGIGVWGGILGGFIGGAAYALIAKHPVGVIADLTAPALLLVQTIGRLGDIVNGEHCARAATDFILAFNWTNPDSDARHCANGVGVPVQPVIAYEMLWNLAALFIIWKLRDKFRPDGMLFALYLAFYAVGRFHGLVPARRQDLGAGTARGALHRHSRAANHRAASGHQGAPGDRGAACGRGRRNRGTPHTQDFPRRAQASRPGRVGLSARGSHVLHRHLQPGIPSPCVQADGVSHVDAAASLAYLVSHVEGNRFYRCPALPETHFQVLPLCPDEACVQDPDAASHEHGRGVVLSEWRERLNEVEVLGREDCELHLAVYIQRGREFVSIQSLGGDAF